VAALTHTQAASFILTRWVDSDRSAFFCAKRVAYELCRNGYPCTAAEVMAVVRTYVKTQSENARLRSRHDQQPEDK
jgi:hypothetical protein